MDDSSTNPYIPQQSEDIRKKVYQRQSPLGRVVKWSMIATIVVAVLVAGGLFFVVPRTTAVDSQGRQKLADALQPTDQVLKRVNVESQLGFKLNYDNHIYSSYAEVGDSTAGSDNSSAVSAQQTYENNNLRVLRAYNYVRIYPIESVNSTRVLAPDPPQLELFATISDKDLVKAAAVPENKGLSKLSLLVKIDGDKRLAKRVLDDGTTVQIDATKGVSTTINGVDYQKVRYTTTNDNHRISNVQYDDCFYTIPDSGQPYSICISNIRPSSVSAASLVEQVFDSITFEQPTVDTSGSSTQDATNKTDASDKTSFVVPRIHLAQAMVNSDSTKNDTPTSNGNASDTNTGTSSNGSSDGTASGSTTENLADAEGESPLLTMTPPYYSNEGSLNSIATMQPSVVRIGMLYCADLALKFETGETATSLTDACTGSLSSGVFVSKDGYIATTGHALRSQKKAAISGYINSAPDQNTMLDRLGRVLDYMFKAQLILESDAEYIKTGASIGDQEALAKVENIASIIPDKYITPIKEEYTYAVQPTEKPIVINRSDTYKPSFAYSDSVLQAKYVASNYDPTKAIQNDFDGATPTVDVGLLKVTGNFPDVPVAANENVKANDTLNVIGYPAYTDSSLTIDKIRNIPVATVTKVDQAYKEDGTRLIQTDDAILPGNDGAPVFDDNGQLIGFSVYGLSYCPDQSCFGNGTVRSSAELMQLLDDNNIKLSTGSPAFASWKEGVNQYLRSNYAASAGAFATAGGQYAYNRWAEPLDKLATAQQGTKFDTSLMNQLQTVMIIVLIILVVVTIILAIVFILQRKRMDMMQVGHYGAGTPPPSPPTQTPSSGPTAPLTQMPSSASVPVQPAARRVDGFAPSTPPANMQTTVYGQQLPAASAPVQPQPYTQPAPQTPPATPAQPDQPLSGPLPPSEDPFYK